MLVNYRQHLATQTKNVINKVTQIELVTQGSYFYATQARR